MYSPIYSFQNVQDEFWFGVWDAFGAAKTNADIDSILDKHFENLQKKYKLQIKDRLTLEREIQGFRLKMQTYA